MLTRLSCKNWRSLHDFTLTDLTPITVLIGANSAGKTNLLDLLYFLRESTEDGVLAALQNRGGAEKVHTASSMPTEPITISFTFQHSPTLNLTYTLAIDVSDPLKPVTTETLIDDDQAVYLQAEPRQGIFLGGKDHFAATALPWERTALSIFGNVPTYPEINYTYQFITQRWQMLDENFMPPLSLLSRATGDLTVIDRCADNMLLVLNFMRKSEPAIYEQLQADLAWLLAHVDSLEVHSDDHETRLAVQEKLLTSREAPTISAGTARIVAILAAYYLLDMRQRAALPGLVVIEEPDTALNPWLLQRLIEQLASYTGRDEARQFLLTTHNPRLLNYLSPEQVCIIQRDEQGYTYAARVPATIRAIWLDEYGLGEVWTTGAFGGVPA